MHGCFGAFPCLCVWVWGPLLLPSISLWLLMIQQQSANPNLQRLVEEKGIWKRNVSLEKGIPFPLLPPPGEVEQKLIGASLSEPYTSVTALWKCVCIYACTFVRLFGPTTYRKFQMSTFKYFTMIACLVHAVTCTSAKPKPWELVWRATARLQVQREGEWERRRLHLNALAAHMATYFLKYGTW